MLKPFWTLPKKVVFTILLAVLAFWLFGCCPSVSTTSHGETDTAYLQQLFAIYNDQYFNNHLPKVPKIDTENGGPDMADSWCDDEQGTSCHISFNLHYTAAPRTSQAVLLHEMCHIKVWSKDLAKNKPAMMSESEYFHGHLWRSCMLSLDSEGAFREINIDYYQEELH